MSNQNNITEWKEQRKLQLPYYSNARIKSLIPRVHDHIQKFLPAFYDLCGKGEFNIYDYLHYWSFNYHLSKNNLQPSFIFHKIHSYNVEYLSEIHMNINQEFSFGDVKKLIDDSPR